PQLRARSRQVPGLRLRHGPRPHHDAEVRHPRPARHVLRRSALAPALRLHRARYAVAGRRAVGLSTIVGCNRALARIAPIRADWSKHRCNAAIALLHPTSTADEATP